MHHSMCMNRSLGRHHLRAWRKHRGKTLVQVAEELHIHRTQLGRIEKGEQPYNEELLSRLAEIYDCAVPDLIVRDPLAHKPMWTIWEQAKPGERRQIEVVAEAIVKTGTNE